jgi:hypothetical protein
MAQSLSNFDAALKDNYGPGLRESINNKSAVWSQVAINDEDIQGRQAVWSVHTARSTATGSRGDLGTLPTASQQGYSQVRDNLASIYHTIQVSGPAVHLSKNDSGSFTRALESELRGAEKDLSNDCARQAYNTAVTIGGALWFGALTGTASSAYAAPAFTFGSAAASTIRHFFVGMSVDVINPTTGAVRGTTTVASINKTTQVVTLAASVAGAASGDYLARTGNMALATTWGYEMNGLPHLLSATQVYAALDPATIVNWAGNAAGSSTTTISEVLFDTASELVETDGDGGEINLFIAEHAQRRKLAQQMQAQKRYDGREVTLKAGWKGLQLERGTLVVDKYCPTTSIFGLNTSELARFVGLDFTWDDDDNRILYKDDTTDSIKARYKAYQNLEVTNRNSHVLITVQAPTF